MCQHPLSLWASRAASGRAWAQCCGSCVMLSGSPRHSPASSLCQPLLPPSDPHHVLPNCFIAFHLVSFLHGPHHVFLFVGLCTFPGRPPRSRCASLPKHKPSENPPEAPPHPQMTPWCPRDPLAPPTCHSSHARSGFSFAVSPNPWAFICFFCPCVGCECSHQL